MKKFSLKDNLIAYLISMRWYGSFIAGMAGFLGIIFSGAEPPASKQIMVLSILFIGWGVNQVINDYLGLAEDKHNAPGRPMVTGKLDVKFAISVSFILFLIGLIITYKLNRQAIIVYLAIFGLNIIYERAKRIPLLGNVAFGLLIAPCVHYAALCVNDATFLSVLTDRRIATLSILVWMVNFVLCFFSDFKDYRGDKEAKIKTLVVLLGIEKAKYLGFILITLPFMYLFLAVRLIFIGGFFLEGTFVVMMITAFLCFLLVAVRFAKYPPEKNSYSIKLLIAATVLFITTLIGLINPLLSMLLFVINPMLLAMVFFSYNNYPA